MNMKSQGFVEMNFAWRDGLTGGSHRGMCARYTTYLATAKRSSKWGFWLSDNPFFLNDMYEPDYCEHAPLGQSPFRNRLCRPYRKIALVILYGRQLLHAIGRKVQNSMPVDHTGQGVKVPT